eukprot:3066317-Amphidinium_carterae.2
MESTYSTTQSSSNGLWIWEPQSNGIAERLVGMSKMLVKRLLESSSLTSDYWNFVIAHAADLLRHCALKVTYPHAAFG